MSAFTEFVGDVSSGEYPQPEHVVPVADDVYEQFVESIWTAWSDMVDTVDTVDSDLELLTVGRIGVDLYAEQLRVPLARGADVPQVDRRHRDQRRGRVRPPGASHGGVHARRRRPVRRVRARHRSRTRSASTPASSAPTPTLRTPLAFAELENPDEPRIIFYREPKAPDMNIASAEVDIDVVATVPMLWFPTSCLSDEPSRTTIHELLDVARPRARTPCSISTGDRSSGADAADATAELDAVLDQVTMAIGNRAECEVAVGESDPDRAADALLARGLEAAIVKMGGDGVLVATADGTRERVAPYPGRGGVWSRRRRRVRRRAVSRTAVGLGPGAVRTGRQRGRCDRRVAPDVRRRHAVRGGDR